MLGPRESDFKRKLASFHAVQTRMSPVFTHAEAPPPAADRELVELPPPRRPWRRATLTSLTLGVVGSLWLALAILPDVAYSLKAGAPRELGELSGRAWDADLANAWVHGSGQLSVTNAIKYRRPLESDSYRLATVEGNPKLWVQIRVPAGEEQPRFVPPDSFVGRLLPVSELGLRQRDLRAAAAEAGLTPPGDDAWLLLDGESPAALRWMLGLFALLLGFAGFNAVGLFRLARPIPTSAGRAP
jgi:hypothetical protein